MSYVDLGAEFRASPVPAQLQPPAPDPGVELLRELRAAVLALPQVIADVMQVQQAPPPIVHVAEPDLSAIVTAVNGLKPGATAADIGREIAKQVNPQPPTENNLMAEALHELIEKIDFRLAGTGRAFGSSGPSNIADNAQRQLGIVSITGTLPGLPLSAGPQTGQTTIASGGVAVQLPNIVCTNGVIVQALAANAGKVYVGPVGVTTSTGFELQAGQATSAGVQNANTIYVNGTGVGDGVCVIAS